MTTCFFVSDLHGRKRRYEALFVAVRDRRPDALLLGGDLTRLGDGLEGLVLPGLNALRDEMGPDYPRVLVILGNDDPRILETEVREAEAARIWEYVHGERTDFFGHPLFGYGCVPPTPFQLKDFERYDVSRFVDPGSISPERGRRSVPVRKGEVRYGTIEKDLALLTGTEDLGDAVLLLHTPPYRTKLDRAALDGKKIDHVTIDVHVGSIAVKRLLEERQPLLALCGHVHESARLTGAWRERIGRTECLSAAHDGPELALVTFDPADPAAASRELL